MVRDVQGTVLEVLPQVAWRGGHAPLVKPGCRQSSTVLRHWLARCCTQGAVLLLLSLAWRERLSVCSLRGRHALSGDFCALHFTMPALLAV
jgi:hypothetical protein